MRLTRRKLLTLLGTTAGGLALAPGARASAGNETRNTVTDTARNTPHAPRPAPPAARARANTVYLGAYTGGDGSHGIGVATADPDSGTLRWGATTPTPEPSFLALSPTRDVLYAVNELAEGRVSAFPVTEDGGVGAPLGDVASGGAAPCHLSLHPGGRHLFTANYVSGTVGVVRLGEDGTPRELVQTVRHTGSGPDPERQTGPHAHMVHPDPTGDRLLAVDLGTDSVYVYHFDPASETLTPHSQVRMPAGSGPRHLAVHPSGRTVYVLGELDASLTTCDYDPEDGTLTPVGTVSTLPDGTSPEGNTAAEVLVTADGAFVYASQRGHDSVTVLTVADDPRSPRLVDQVDCGGAGPRHLAFDADHTRLYVANQQSGSVTVFDRDAATGALTPTGQPLAFPQVVCVLPADA